MLAVKRPRFSGQQNYSSSRQLLGSMHSPMWLEGGTRLGGKLRIGAGCGLALLCGRLAHGPVPAAPPVSSPPPVVVPVVDLDRLYDLEFLVLEGDGPRLALGPDAPPPPGPARPDAVPEPAGSLLWILGLAVVCTLYLPGRSW